MSFNVGMPMLGLKRGSAHGKHAANLRKILDEAGTERYSATKNLDPSKSKNNVHLGGYSSGEDAYAAIMQEVDDYETEYKKTSYRGRGLRSDATVAVAFIVKPEGDWINKQPPDVQAKFFSDSFDVLCELGVVNKDYVRMRERHLDEASPHEHYVEMAYDKNGKLAGSHIVNLKTFSKLNRDYPKKMQERGWDVNELKAYDAEAVKDMTPEEAADYKEKHIAEKERRHGLSANEYAAMKEAEKAVETAKQANELRHDIEDEIADLEPKHKQAKKDIEDAEAKKEEAYKEGFKAYSLARDIEQAMNVPQTHRSLTEVVEDAEEHYKDLGERSNKIATATARLAQKEQQANDLIADLQKAKQEQPTSKESWMVSWFREHAPKAFAACEKAYERAHQAFSSKRAQLEGRTRELFNEIGRNGEQSEDGYEKY